MRTRIHPIIRLSLCILFVAALSIAVYADSSHERTQVGHDISVGPGEQTGEVTCFGCSVRVLGQVNGDITTFGGSVILEDSAEVTGDLTTFGGNLRMDGPVKVSGDVAVFGGRIHRDPSSTIGGDVTSFGGGGLWMALIFGLPLILLGAFIALIVWLVRIVTRPRIPATA